jgi:hypothetical protein
MMTAAEANRDLIYYTFNDANTYESLTKIVEIIEKKDINVGQMYELIQEYADEIRRLDTSQINKFRLCEFLHTKYN